MSKKDFLITVIIVVLAIALIATIIVLKKVDKVNSGDPTGTTSGVAHDHDGDGVPDHGDDAHENQDSEDNTTGTTSGDSTSGNNEDAVVPDDSGIDISIGLEDLPADGGDSGDTDSGNTDSGNPDSDSTESGNTGSVDGGSTGTTEGDTEQGSTSGARPGNEIDFDDLINAGKK